MFIRWLPHSFFPHLVLAFVGNDTTTTFKVLVWCFLCDFIEMSKEGRRCKCIGGFEDNGLQCLEADGFGLWLLVCSWLVMWQQWLWCYLQERSLSAILFVNQWILQTVSRKKVRNTHLQFWGSFSYFSWNPLDPNLLLGFPLAAEALD